MTEIIPNVYRLELPLPGKLVINVNAYLVCGDNEYLLIDTGWDTDETLSSLRKQLAEIGIQPEDISQIVATHIHPDHYGLAGKLRELSHAKIALHYLEKELIQTRYRDIGKLIRQAVEWMRTNGVPNDELSERLSELETKRPEMLKFSVPALPDTTLRGDEIITVGSFSFRVLWTPGHSPGHICLYEPAQQILISGDHILPDVTTVVGPELDADASPLDDYINSLNEIKKLNTRLVLPGHGEPFTGLTQRIDEIMQSQSQRGSEILEAVKTGAKTAYQVSGEIPWAVDSNPVGYQNLSPWDSRLALLKTLAHLESMRFRGIVDKFTRSGIIYYQTT